MQSFTPDGQQERLDLGEAVTGVDDHIVDLGTPAESGLDHVRGCPAPVFPPLGETGEDVGGHRTRFHLSPESIDTEQSLYLAVVDTEDDVTGQGWRHILEPEAADIEA